MPRLKGGKKVMKYAECGAFGHAWYESDMEPAILYGVPIYLICERCGSERIDSTTFTTGEIISRRYKHPYDYSYPKGLRPSRNDFRRAFLYKRKETERAQREENIIPIKRKKAQ